jgi:pimeloyl-ACP methyl ester carboxylesterase
MKGLAALAFATAMATGIATAAETAPAAAPAAAAPAAATPEKYPVWKKVPIPAQAPMAYEGYAKFKGKDKDIKLWYWDTGGKGEVLVLLHPWSQSSEIWKYQQPVFSAAGYRVIALSRRGAYKSIPGPKENPGTASDDVLKLVDSLKIKKFHLIGCAAGGVTATNFAINHPDRLHSLVICNSIVLPDEQEYRDASARLAMISSQPLGGEELGRATMWRELGPNYRLGNPEGSKIWADMEHVSRPQGLYNGQAWGAKVNWETMGKMPVKTLVMTGDTDLWAPPALQRLYANKLPNAEVAVIREAGHATYWEQPEEFNRMMLEWLAKNKPAAETK